jgi:hypothetical protein
MDNAQNSDSDINIPSTQRSDEFETCSGVINTKINVTNDYILYIYIYSSAVGRLIIKGTSLEIGDVSYLDGQ